MNRLILSTALLAIASSTCFSAAYTSEENHTKHMPSAASTPATPSMRASEDRTPPAAAAPMERPRIMRTPLFPHSPLIAGIPDADRSTLITPEKAPRFPSMPQFAHNEPFRHQE